MKLKFGLGSVWRLSYVWFVSRRCLAKILLGAVVSLIATGLTASDPDASSVVILVNEADSDSVAIGEHYAKKRGIPKDNIIRLKMPLTETITLNQFVETISNPLLDALLEKEWISGVKDREPDRYGRERLTVSFHKIRYLVTVRGVPLRFSDALDLIEADTKFPKQFRHNRASVDSELSLLPGPPGLTMTALIPNPYFNGRPASEDEKHRVIQVSRLDGPTRQDVIRLIDRTLEAEQKGLAGRAYIDLGGPHVKGDKWIKEAGELLKAAYFDTEFEDTKRHRDYQDRLDVPAIYIGWYSRHAYGPWLDPEWSVPAGAIGYHLHSFSATTVRSSKREWVGPFVARGFCATFGYVYEPYLEYTVHPHVFIEHLLKGGSFGDAIFLGSPMLSWQTAAIGDPLYRPFKVSLNSQLKQLEAHSLGSYVGLRKMNRLEAEGSTEDAVVYGKKLLLSHPSLAVVYRLAEAQVKLGQQKEAIEVLKVIRHIDVYEHDERALVRRIADLLHELGESQLAFEVYQKMLEAHDLPRGLHITLYERGAPIAATVGQSILSSRWALEARKLKQAVGK